MDICGECPSTLQLRTRFLCNNTRSHHFLKVQTTSKVCLCRSAVTRPLQMVSGIEQQRSESPNLWDAAGVYSRVRKHFSYFDPDKDHPIYMESAGVSQCPKVVIDSMAEYMKTMYFQIGAGYELSNRATQTVNSAREFMKTFVNGGGVGEVAFGCASSQILETLSHAYFNVLQEGDEVIVQEANHEANAGPWIKLAEKRGLCVKFWKANRDFSSTLQSLGEVLSSRTRIVAVSHVSNVLGEILDLQRMVKFVKEEMGSKRARVVVDGVAFAPHRAIDVAKWGIDWYVFSTYKVCGPHMAVLFGTHDAFNEVKDGLPNVYFIHPHNYAAKFELGCLNHEGCAAILALKQYLKSLAQEEDSALNLGFRGGGAQQEKPIQDVHKCLSALNVEKSADRGVIESAFRTVELLEQPLQMALMEYLKSRSDVLIVGPDTADGGVRVPTVSFVHHRKKSSDIARALHRMGFAVRNGHMYTHRLISALCSHNLLFNNDVNEGVVRISMLHYNTPSEVSHLISCLDDIL